MVSGWVKYWAAYAANDNKGLLHQSRCVRRLWTTTPGLRIFKGFNTSAGPHLTHYHYLWDTLNIAKSKECLKSHNCEFTPLLSLLNLYVFPKLVFVKQNWIFLHNSRTSNIVLDDHTADKMAVLDAPTGYLAQFWNQGRLALDVVGCRQAGGGGRKVHPGGTMTPPTPTPPLFHPPKFQVPHLSFSYIENNQYHDSYRFHFHLPCISC